MINKIQNVSFKATYIATHLDNLSDENKEKLDNTAQCLNYAYPHNDILIFHSQYDDEITVQIQKTDSMSYLLGKKVLAKTKMSEKEMLGHLALAFSMKNVHDKLWNIPNEAMRISISNISKLSEIDIGKIIFGAVETFREKYPDELN